MKTFKLSRLAFVLGSALIMGVPATVLVSGCGGGSSSPGIRLFSAPVQLNAAQTATLNLSVRGQGISGSLIVPTPTGNGSATIPAGTYTLTDTFLPPRGFSLLGTLPNSGGSFTITGQIPTSSEAGNFSLTVGDQTISGPIPIISPTSTPVATATSTLTP